MANLAASSLENNCEFSTKPINQDCPVSTAIEVIGGKWKVIILYQLRGKTLRFGELKRLIPKITQKTLTQQLRDLEKDKLIERTVYAEVPPRVEYTPTELAERLNPALDLLCAWGGEYRVAHGHTSK
ncbi:winged helix-turn-helix transcriptional regulator [Agarivorans gilvus]|jgi:DNA-binding HxlR family transcriptional regulator|uniref:Transcriptional regulator n=1 Tax=Agarivorans gilvus TaxID=680279 RepID=A0ABQ1HZ62_9ALTE|nr:helix-turn-helix domain-containing protein [Agarivorans gilvus]GGB00581.1 transcriptional regulator [Agarivorans gilvus]